MFRQIFCWVSASRYWLFKREDIPEAGGGQFKDGQWILGGLLQHWNGNIQNEIMGSANVSPTLVARRTCPDTYLDVTGCYLSLRTQHVATLPWLHRLIQEPWSCWVSCLFNWSKLVIHRSIFLSSCDPARHISPLFVAYDASVRLCTGFLQVVAGVYRRNFVGSCVAHVYSWSVAQ